MLLLWTHILIIFLVPCSPYLSSPVKQKVQAFEKHGATTPDKSKATSSKYVRIMLIF